MTWTPTMGQREDLFRVTIRIDGTDGKTVKFTVDKMDGGAVQAKETKYRPGNGTENEKSLGGARTVTNVTVTALQTYDMYVQVPWMMVQVGKGDMTVSKQPLDKNGSPFGKALVYSGNLNACTPPKTDSESDAAALIAWELSAVTPVKTG